MRKRGFRSTFFHAGRESAPNSEPATTTNSRTAVRMIAMVSSIAKCYASRHSILFDALEETAAAVAGFLNGTASTAAP